jgi:cytochrome c oxidase assembly factor CtaG
LSLKEKALFLLALFLIYLIKGSPIDLLGHLMLTFHMVQMALLYMLVPQLLFAAVPAWVWKKWIELPGIRQLFRFFTKPLMALVGFNGLFSLYHVPVIFDAVKTNAWLHGIYTGVLFVFALFMWWPLLNQLEPYQTLTGLKRVGYIFADGALLTPACALIMFSPEPFYATYTNPELWIRQLSLCVPADRLASLDLPGPEIINPLSLHDDQQLGGVIMKILQELFYGFVLLRVFIEWYRNETENSGPAIRHQ